MSLDTDLVDSMVDRLSDRLPHRTGLTTNDLRRDELVLLTRATLIEVSSNSIDKVIDALLSLLEGPLRCQGPVNTHPTHVLLSELYVLELLACCCLAHWNSINGLQRRPQNGDIENGSLADDTNDRSPEDSDDGEGEEEKGDGYSPSSGHTKSKNPKPLDELMVVRVFDAIKVFTSTVTENHSLPAFQILDEGSASFPELNTVEHVEAFGADNELFGADATIILLRTKANDIRLQIRSIVEFLSAANWAFVFEHMKSTLRGLRTTHVPPNSAQSQVLGEEEKDALAIIRSISAYTVDMRKLASVIQEVSGSFLHLRKSFQHAVAIVMPLLITRWLERNPNEFLLLHSGQQRLDGGIDTLFDMINAMIDGVRRKTLLFPLQMSLLFLLPEVFEIASNMRDTKSISMVKKVAFLDSLRKALRNKNEVAAYCLISLLRVARHFNTDSDAALLSYALDVQDEVRELVFRAVGSEAENAFNQELMTAAFVSLTSVNLEKSINNLAPICLRATSPESFKVAAISACAHFARQRDSHRYEKLTMAVASFVRSQLKVFQMGQELASKEGGHSAAQPRAPGALIYTILMFLDLSPLTLLEDSPSNLADYNAFIRDVQSSFIYCLSARDERITALTSSVSRKIMARGSISLWRESVSAGEQDFPTHFWQSTSTILNALSDHVLTSKGPVKPTLNFIYDYLKSRVALVRNMQQLLEVPEQVPEYSIAATKLETVFLVSLCSADIETCQLVTSCIANFCEEERLMLEAASEATNSLLAATKNLDSYLALSSRSFRFTGLVAFQKRLRTLLRGMKHPTTGLLNAWEIVFRKWCDKSKQILSTRAGEGLDEKSLVEWRNYSGFLASLGSSCVSEQASALDETGLAGLKWIDRLSEESNDQTLLDRYMVQSIQLLACNNVRVREATREVLSSEISSSLYLPLFRSLETELDMLFSTSRATSSKSPEFRLVFAEQAAALLKSIVERLSSPAEFGAALSIDIGALSLNFARFVDDIPDGSSTLRVKIKVCQLCELVTRKKELLNLRHDVRVRNQLLEVIFGWIARPGSPNVDDTVLLGLNRAEENVRLQRELDRSCMRALADLTYRLPLQPSEGQTDADTSDLKSQMFSTYFNKFLSLLRYDAVEVVKSDLQAVMAARDDAVPTSELTITTLSNLLSANIDVGLKHSLGIGYHDDLDIRTAFVKVLCNILIQGTEFNTLTDLAVNEKYDKLLQLLTDDMTLTIALCDACPSNEVDEMTISLLDIFESRGLVFDLFQALIEHEVEETENEADLLRRTCVTTKMLSVYAKWKGAEYLKDTLQKVLERLMATADDLDLELDPSKMASTEELQRNALQLRVVTKVFIEDICTSTTNIPTSFRKICSIISSTVMTRFPEAKFTAVGSFIFLRFFCPAIVAPDAEGLIPSAPSKEMRRGLLLITKVVQSLANNILFGAKEAYMIPLNEFLTQNIYRVTTFLREISVSPNIQTMSPESESFDFGSCVALHRFLYDHWDQVRQKLVIQERKGSIRSPIDTNKVRASVLDALRSLITNLGPPPTDISWNRPMISANSPPSYSRFQHFMLLNAGRNTEALVSGRAVYDGGESKDGLPMICVILRNIETDNIDYDLLIFCYLKIASRMWHRPFGILIDATSYIGQNEPQDALFRKLDSLTPTELSRQLTRVYVYNMNSAFRKCFRRILRLSAKSDTSAFHHKNVEYHLIGSLQDLHNHFHLNQLHLPKETISVVTDTRFLFQPIIRLSKTKGKIEVVIKIGSEFLQVTTTRRQEIVTGLRLNATVNDIFRLTDVDEAPTSIQTEDDSAFGLRTENGKIVMYFTSPRKADVLQALRNAKLKHGKEYKAPKSFERLIRPQDVPGTLLNIALSNMLSTDRVLRVASYNLLCALCQAFRFAINSRFMTPKDLCVPLNPSQFVIRVSRELALSEPRLTSDFLNEFFVSWENSPYHQRPLSLSYMASWLPNLRTHVLPNEPDSEKAKEKVAVIYRKLLDLAMSDPLLGTTLEHVVWPIICQDEIDMDIFLEEIIKTAMSFGLEDERLELIGSIVASLGTVTVRGKLLSRLRKALNRTSLRSTRTLPENNVWAEICVLLRLCLSASFDCGTQSQLYLPELFHVITMLSNTGSPEVKFVVHRLLINTVHAICTSFLLDEIRLTRLRAILATLSDAREEISSTAVAIQRDGMLLQAVEGAGAVNMATDVLTGYLSEISIIAAPNVDLSNAWRSRWMSLVASTAFQSNPAVQPRAFTVMGCLARQDVDDDLLYQVLVALKNSLTRFTDDHDDEMLVAIVTSLTKMMEKLPTASRYGLQLFWLAMSLVRLVPLALFNCTALFLEAVLGNISASGEFQGGRMIPVLMQGRLPVEDAAAQLDDIYGIHFGADNFHFAVCASLVKGLTDSVTKTIALRVLSSFLEVSSSNMPDGCRFPKDLTCWPYLGLVVSHARSTEEAREALWLAGIIATGNGELDGVLDMVDVDSVNDRELLLNIAISITDFGYLEDAVQSRCLLWLNKLALERTPVLLHLCAPVLSILDGVLLSSQNSMTLEAAHTLLRTLTKRPTLFGGIDTADMLDNVLEDIGFSGLWRSSTFHATSVHDRECTLLTDKLIELVIV